MGHAHILPREQRWECRGLLVGGARTGRQRRAAHVYRAAHHCEMVGLKRERDLVL